MCGRILAGWAAAARRWLLGVPAAVVVIMSSGRAEAAPLYSVQTIDVPGAVRTEARGINNHGHVVGSFEAADGTVHGFLYDGATYHTLSYPGAIQTDANGINDAGQIVGSYFNGIEATPTGGGFLFESGAYSPVAGPGGAAAGLFDINNQGAILGASGPQYGSSGFVLRNGAYRPVAAPGARETRVTGINDAGRVVGYGYYSPIPSPDDPFPSPGANIRAFVFDDTGFSFPPFGAPQGYAEAINGLNEVLGAGSGNGRFLESLDTSLRINLNELSVLEDLNDRGQIVGSYGDGKTMHGYIATPVPEPTSRLLFVGASLSLLCATSRVDRLVRRVFNGRNTSSGREMRSFRANTSAATRAFCLPEREQEGEDLCAFAQSC
jgi:probable HAF family extracellular repeat protein